MRQAAGRDRNVLPSARLIRHVPWAQVLTWISPCLDIVSGKLRTKQSSLAEFGRCFICDTVSIMATPPLDLSGYLAGKNVNVSEFDGAFLSQQIEVSHSLTNLQNYLMLQVF